jgi:hypothetical protein
MYWTPLLYGTVMIIYIARYNSELLVLHTQSVFVSYASQNKQQLVSKERGGQSTRTVFAKRY